jgi:hypothetical protein
MDVNEEIRATLARLRELLDALQSGNFQIGTTSERRRETKIADLRRQIARYQSILDRQGS